MRHIEITGKRNTDKINNVVLPERKKMSTLNLDDCYYTYKKQVEIINKLFLNESVQNEMIIKKELTTKITGYGYQDVRNQINVLDQLISLDQVIELMVNSKLKCVYCKESCELLYKHVLSKKQWTLDRIDNNVGHTYENVVICCLECNIQRGSMDSDRFKKGKQIKIVKKLY